MVAALPGMAWLPFYLVFAQFSHEECVGRRGVEVEGGGGEGESPVVSTPVRGVGALVCVCWCARV